MNDFNLNTVLARLTFTCFLIGILLLFSGTAFSQSSFIPYYNLSNKGDSLMYFKQYAEAHQAYEAAIQSVPPTVGHAHTFKAAAVAAALNGKFELAKKHCSYAIVYGLEPDFLKDKRLKSFRKSPVYQALKEEIPSFYEWRRKLFDSTYAKLIDSLFYLDQHLLRGAPARGRHYAITKSELMEMSPNPDSLIFDTLVKVMRKWGFPSENRVGFAAYDQAALIIHHNARMPQNVAWLEKLKTHVINGDYLPADYAWMADQSQLFRGEEPLFYWGVSPIDQLSEAKKDSIDQIRREHGIKPFSAFQIKAKKKSLVQKILW